MAAITITNAGRNMLRDALKGTGQPLISYVALGTSNTGPSAGDVKLGAEAFRKKVTSYANGVNPGEIIINMYLSSSDAVGTGIQEVGFFGGSTASSTPNSGILLARGLYTHTKTGIESITFQLDFQLS